MKDTYKYNQQNQPEVMTVTLAIGIYLSVLATALLLVLIFAPIAIEIQQVIVVVVGLLFLVSISTFMKIINPKKDTDLLDRYKPYFDNRIFTYNYNGDTFYNNKQNLADAAEEIKTLLDKLSKNYDESPIDKSSIDIDLLRKIEKIEAESPEKLTEKEKVITAQVVEEIDKNSRLKERFIEAFRVGGEGKLQTIPFANISSKVLQILSSSSENDYTESTKNNSVGQY